MANLPISFEEIDQLERTGQLTPETAQAARAQMASANPDVPMSVEQPPVGGEMVSFSPMEQIAPDYTAASSQAPTISSLPRDPAMNTPNPIIPQPTSTPNPEMSPVAPQFEPAPAMNLVQQGVPNKRIAGIEAGYAKQQQAMLDAAKAGSDKAMEEASYLKTAREELDKMNAQQQQREVERQQFLDKEMSEYKKIEQTALDSTVDPTRFWASKSTGQKVMASIGLFFGGIAQGFGAAKNPAQEILQNAIQNDIDAQKSEIEKLKDIGSAKRNLYGQFLERFKDTRQAEAATKLTMLQKVEMQMKEVAARHKAPEIQASALKAQGELQVLKNAALMQFEQAAQAKQQIQLRGGAQLPAGIDIEELSPDQRDRYVPGVGLASTKEGAKEVREFKSTVDTVNSGIQDLIGFTTKTGDSLNPADRARAQATASMLVGQLRLPIVGPGAVTERELELLQSIVADPTKIMSLDAVSKASLETVSKRLNAQLSDKAKTNGLRPVNQQVSSFQPR